MLDDAAETVLLRTRDPHEALAELRERDRQHVFLEGGPTLAAAFLRRRPGRRGGRLRRARCCSGPACSGVGDLGIATIADALHLDVADVTVLGTGPDTNVRLTMTRHARRAD